MLYPLILTSVGGFFVGIPLSMLAGLICTFIDEYIFSVNFNEPGNSMGSMIFLGMVMSMILVPLICWFSRNGNEFSTE